MKERGRNRTTDIQHAVLDISVDCVDGEIAMAAEHVPESQAVGRLYDT